MRIPAQIRRPRSVKTVSAFRGLDRRLGAGDDTFFEMTNMTGDADNCISSRAPRGSLDLGGASVYSMICTDVLIDGEVKENAFIVDGGSRLRAFYYEDGELKSTVIMNTTGFTTGKNKMIASGGYLYFFPDKKYVNLMNTRDMGSLTASVEMPMGAADNLYYELKLESTDEKGENVAENSGYVRVKCEKYKYTNSAKGDFLANFIFAVSFKENDVVQISGTGNFDGNYKIAYIPDDYSYMVVRGYIDSGTTISSGLVAVSRDIPDMDHVIAAGNRLWGCKYGVNEKGEPINEIYASRLGDAKNWYSFDGISTDSYVASVGCDGVFTGAVVFEDDPLFFKEDAIIRIYGSTPSDFTVLTRNVRGIEKGSADSAVTVDDVLYYKTYNGIVAYNGGLPYNVDAPLGNGIYKKAVAGTRKGKLYISMQNSDGEYELYVYDTAREIWHKEDALKASGFCRCGNELYMLKDNDGTNEIWSVCGSGNGECEGEVEWSCETGEMDYLLPNRKYVSRLIIKCELGEEAYFKAEICYDGGDNWYKVCARMGDEHIISVPVNLRRCHSFRLRFSGHGQFRLISVSRIEVSCGDYR